MGLAWTALGGSTLYVEAASVERGEGKGSLRSTGAGGARLLVSLATRPGHAAARAARGPPTPLPHHPPPPLRPPPPPPMQANWGR